MPDYQAATQGGFNPLLEEAMPSLTASTQIFKNAPAGTRRIELTIRTQGIVLRFRGGAATTTVGHDYPVGTYEFDFSQEKARQVYAIEQTSSAGGYITYFGNA